MMRIAIRVCFCIAAIILARHGSSQSPAWTVQHHDSKASLRGLCVVDDHVVWASGSDQTVLLSIDAGETWQQVGPRPLDDKPLDFRSIHAFDSQRAVVFSAGTPARAYLTINAGQSWEIVFDDTREAAFYDAVVFNDETGLAFSDPIDGRLALAKSVDAGTNWASLPENSLPKTFDGEAGFAASGSSLFIDKRNVWIGLGGKNVSGRARILRSNDGGQTWQTAATPMICNEKSGVFSLVFSDQIHGVAVGGTYDDPDNSNSNVCITSDGGKTWHVPDGKPSGFRSAVDVTLTKVPPEWICVGRNGCDVSTDNGNHWKRTSNEPFHAVRYTPNGKTCIAVGRDGKIGIRK